MWENFLCRKIPVVIVKCTGACLTNAPSTTIKPRNARHCETRALQECEFKRSHWRLLHKGGELGLGAVRVLVHLQSLVLPVFKCQPLDEPQSTESQATGLCCFEGPGHSVNVVEELVRKRRNHRFVRHPFMDDNDYDSVEDEGEEGVDKGHARFPPLFRERVVRLLGDLVVVAALLYLVAQRVYQLVLFQHFSNFSAPAFAVTIENILRMRCPGDVVSMVGHLRRLRRWRRICRNHLYAVFIIFLDQFWCCHWSLWQISSLIYVKKFNEFFDHSQEWASVSIMKKSDCQQRLSSLVCKPFGINDRAAIFSICSDVTEKAGDRHKPEKKKTMSKKNNYNYNSVMSYQ